MGRIGPNINFSPKLGRKYKIFPDAFNPSLWFTSASKSLLSCCESHLSSNAITEKVFAFGFHIKGLHVDSKLFLQIVITRIDCSADVVAQYFIIAWKENFLSPKNGIVTLAMFMFVDSVGFFNSDFRWAVVVGSSYNPSNFPSHYFTLGGLLYLECMLEYFNGTKYHPQSVIRDFNVLLWLVWINLSLNMRANE